MTNYMNSSSDWGTTYFIYNTGFRIWTMHLSDQSYIHTTINTGNLLSVQNLSHFIHINVAGWEEFHAMFFKQGKCTPELCLA